MKILHTENGQSIQTFDFAAKDHPEFPDHVVWLDIETRKAAAPAGWPQKTRWQPFMASIACCWAGTLCFRLIESEDEGTLISWLQGDLLTYGPTVRYAATREFDEMVLRGRFTNARRAHNPVAGSWPHIDARQLTWQNVRKTLRYTPPRALDCGSAAVPTLWASGGEASKKLVRLHCLRDVVQLVAGDANTLIPLMARILLDDTILED